MTVSSKSAKHLAGASLALNALFFAIALLIGLWSGFYAIFAVSWLILGAVLIWFVLLLQFHQRCLAEQEKLDTSRLAKDKQAPTIFRAGDEHARVFAVAQRRLRLFEKWFLPIFSAAIAAYQLGIGLYLFNAIPAAGAAQTKEPLVCAVIMAAIAFVSFLLSHYAIGMSGQTRWKPIRAGGSFLLGVAVLCFVMAVALSLFMFKIVVLLYVANWAIPVLLIVLGIETALNVVLDIYRPRLEGQYHRSAFDSRLLGLISEPGGLFRTAASTIDYQFGFKVSQTWFYKLLEKAIVPLILFAAVTLYLLSCIVIVTPNEEAIIEHFGNPLNDANQVRHIGPGLAFKWPWPIDTAFKYPTKKIAEINVGFVPKRLKKTVGYGPLLWGKTHYEKEYKLLVASESDQPGSEAVPVSLVMAAVPVQYRVKDLYSFLYNYEVTEQLDGSKLYGAEQRLEAVCYNELTKFAASAKIEVETGSGINQSLLGAGRAGAKKILTERIQSAADRAGLGIEIVFLGLQGIHPPPEVAADYQKVVGAVQEKQAAILRAQAQRNKILSSLAGSVQDANELYLLATQYQKAKDQSDTEKIERLGKELDQAFAQAKGEIFEKLRQAQSYAFERSTLSHATGLRFAGQLKAYRAAPEIYTQEQRLLALEKSLEDIRKYVVVADQNDTQITIVDLQEKLTPDVYNLKK